jgi:peptidoglycan-N-acetylglucosamine deacetylase
LKAFSPAMRMPAVAIVALAFLTACTSTTVPASPTPPTGRGSPPPGATGLSTPIPTTDVSPAPGGATPSPTVETTPGTTDTPGPTASPTPSVTPHPTKPPPVWPSYITHGKRNKKVIALTFDADMYPFMYAERNQYTEYDPRVIKLLEDQDIPATIFLNGLYVKAYPDLIKELVKEDPNIELGNHTWDHAGWTSTCTNTTPIAAPMTKAKEISKAADIIKSDTGVKVKYFRYPGGCYGGGDISVVKSLGEIPIGWDCYFGDPLGWSAQQQIASVETGCQNGSIVITHLNGPRFHPNIYQALKALLKYWKRNGWTIVNVGTLLSMPTPPAKP